MREPGGDFQPHVEGCFLDIAPEARLVFTTVLKEGWRPAEPWLAMTAIITFEAEAGGARYSARALNKSAEDSRKHDEMGSRRAGGRRSTSWRGLWRGGLGAEGQVLAG